MTEPQEKPSARQDELERLLEEATQAPGAADAMAAYEEIQRSAVRVVQTQGSVTYSTGGNS